MRVIVYFLFPVLLISTIFSEYIITFLFGKQWLPASYYFSLLIFAGLLLILETLLRTFIKSLCAVKELMYVTLVKRVLGIVIIISCFIGVIMNVYLYSTEINCRTIDTFFSIVKLTIPSLLLFIVLIMLYLSINNVGLLSTLFILLIVSYYFLMYSQVRKVKFS